MVWWWGSSQYQNDIYIYIERERERERHTHTERETETETETDRQTDRQTDRDRDRQTDRQKGEEWTSLNTQKRERSTQTEGRTVWEGGVPDTLKTKKQQTQT